jgi:hypothetical protein
MRLHQVAAYSSRNGRSQECAVLFAQFNNEKRFFVMAITVTTAVLARPPFASIMISLTAE